MNTYLLTVSMTVMVVVNHRVNTPAHVNFFVVLVQSVPEVDITCTPLPHPVPNDIIAFEPRGMGQPLHNHNDYT